MRSISLLIKPVSGMCNMKCDYCFYSDEANKRANAMHGIMSEELLETIIKKAIFQADTVVSFTWQGGEPTLRGLDFFKKAVMLQKHYQQKYQKRNLWVMNSFQTNGYMVDEKWAAFFKENRFLVGLSLDGLREIHDSLRKGKDGEKSFSRVCRAAGFLDLYQVDYNILTVVTPQIATRIREIYPFYRKCGWDYQQYIACLDPFGEKPGKQSYSISPDLYGKFLSDLFELWYQDLKKRKQPYIRQFENYVGLAAGYMPEACDQRGFCSVQYVIEADGSVYPCDFYAMDAYQIGNFYTDSFTDIDKKRSELGLIERSFRIENECRKCPYFQLCRGGCMRNRENSMEQRAGLNNLCEGYRIFFEKWYDTLIQLGKLVK